MNLTLFLLLALTASRTGLVRCEEVKDGDIVENASEGEDETQVSGDGRPEDMDSDATPNSDSVGHVETNLTTAADTDEVTEDLNLVIMIIIPLVLTLVIIAVIVCVVMIYHRGRKVAGTKEDPYLDHEDHEKVPMPMFEDDIPSVMELEMEDLENWISKDGGKKVDTGQI